ncbi:uncharacterized protein LOC117787177 [Drosophila innubila]|uniref:uncharacterized protein LOC117787177 n=1 Tax=Drosophila innubila TaxID=198719 RepID=UPI00148C1047|nr:uncharacterized protein LOC117787177 [Drosophila innubila]
MGCASSTPMVATAGSEMLKAATHVAGDVKQKGEAALEDATETLNTTMDTAKETVSTAVAGITNELGNAFKDGTEKLDEAKHKVMEGLHLETRPDVGKTTEPEVLSTSRAPTPALEADGDSLKTSTPEPEIERALANSSANEEEAPPTPKPSLQELAELSAQVGEVDAKVATATATAADAAAAATAAANVESRWYRRMENGDEQRRPSTTEWEKLADQLAKSRKFKPYESFAHSQNQFSVYKDYTSLRDKPGHYDGHFSGGNSQQSSASQSQSDLSSGHLTPAPPTRRGHRDYAKFVGSEQPASVSRASSRLSNVGGVNGRTFDFNPQRERISLPIATSRAVGSRVGSALNVRRSLWARGQPEVLPEEPHHTYSPIRRSSMTVGLRQSLSGARDERNLQVARSTSNLTCSSLTKRKEAQKIDKPRLSTADNAKKQLPGSRRPSEPAYKEIEEVRSERIESSRPQKHLNSEKVISSKPEKSSLPAKEVKADLNEAFTSMLRDSARDISSAVLLATPLTTTSMLHSPSRARPAICSPISSSTSNKMATPLASRASTFIAGTTERRSSVVKYDTPLKTPQLHTPTRLKTASVIDVVAECQRGERDRDSIHQHVLLKTNAKTTPRKTISGHATPIRMRINAEPILATTIAKSPSRASSRLSSASSSEVVIKPLSHLTTPSAISGSPGSSQVVMTEYEDIDLEAALARLADWRGSTTTLHSLRSSNSRMERNSRNSSRLNSRRTSPWIRSYPDHNQSKDSRTFSSCGIAELSSPSKAVHKPLELCEICCNEIVMN